MFTPLSTHKYNIKRNDSEAYIQNDGITQNKSISDGEATIYPRTIDCSLFSSYFSIKKISIDGEKSVLGVFSKVTVPTSTRFGPLQLPQDAPVYELILDANKDTGECYSVDVSNKDIVSWIFIRSTEINEQHNITLKKIDDVLYYVCLTNIEVGQEIKLLYNVHNPWRDSLIRNIKGLSLERTSNEICNVQERYIMQPDKSTNEFDEKIKQNRRKGSLKGSRISQRKRNTIKATSKKFECPICKNSFNSLRGHVQTHSKDGIFHCPQCPKETPWYHIIRKHIKYAHFTGRKYVCEFCDKCFPNNDKLHTHTLIHSDEKRFLCAVCGGQFKRKDKLVGHMKNVHTEEKELRRQRKKQSKKKKTNPALRNRSVEDEEKYLNSLFKCRLCLLAFRRRGMLVKHMNSNHPDISLSTVPELALPIFKTQRNFHCHFCEKVYKSNSKRKLHILKNHPEEELPEDVKLKNNFRNSNYVKDVGYVSCDPYECEWCNCQYSTKIRLVIHQKKHHSDKLTSYKTQDSR